MNIIDIIAIIPYFITLATVVAEEEDTLNLPKAPVSPQVSDEIKKEMKPMEWAIQKLTSLVFFILFLHRQQRHSKTGQVNESGYVLSNIAGDTFSASVSNI